MPGVLLYIYLLFVSVLCSISVVSLTVESTPRNGPHLYSSGSPAVFDADEPYAADRDVSGDLSDDHGSDLVVR